MSLFRNALNLGKTTVALKTRISGKVQRALNEVDEKNLIACACFHEMSQKNMENLVHWMRKNHYSFVSQEDVISAILGEKKLNSRSIWMSFDDGWKSNLTDVFPVLRKHGIPYTVFVSPAETMRGIFWPQVIRSKASTVKKLFDMSINEFRLLPTATRLSYYEQLLEHLGNDVPRSLMTADDVCELSKDPLASIENHTMNHVASNSCTFDEFRCELEQANEMIEQWAGKRPSVFCYPFGFWSMELDKIVKESGMKMSMIVGHRLLNLKKTQSPFLVPRVLPDGASLSEMVCKLTGRWNLPMFQYVG